MESQSSASRGNNSPVLNKKRFVNNRKGQEREREREIGVFYSESRLGSNPWPWYLNSDTKALSQIFSQRKSSNPALINIIVCPHRVPRMLSASSHSTSRPSKPETPAVQDYARKTPVQQRISPLVYYKRRGPHHCRSEVFKPRMILREQKPTTSTSTVASTSSPPSTRRKRSRMTSLTQISSSDSTNSATRESIAAPSRLRTLTRQPLKLSIQAAAQAPSLAFCLLLKIS